jgi:imidazolonepropionase-like amidohydrolase
MKSSLAFAGALLLGSTALSAASADDSVPRTDRNAWIAPGTNTDHTPRMIPERPEPATGAVTVLRGGLVFDSRSLKVAPGSVVLRGDRIVAVLPAASTDWPADAQVIDATGKFVMPGLIDMHVHVTYPDADTPEDVQAEDADGVLRGLRNLRWFLESGFTSVRDLNGVNDAPYRLADWSAADLIPAPRVFTAGHIITGTGGHATERPVRPSHGPAFAWERDGADAWRAAVRQTFKNGATVIKVASHFAPDEIQAAVDEAHRLGLKVTCDCETIYTKMAVDAGIDMIEHPLPRTDETIADMARHKTAAVPTLQVYQNVLDRAGGFWGSTSRRFTMTSDANFALFRKMKQAGIVMGVGTDTIGDANKMTPNIYLAELKWFVKGGYSIPQALQAATLTNAQLLGMNDMLGSLEPGKLADVLVIDGRPDQDIDALHKVAMVFKDGQLVVQGGAVVIAPHVPKPLPKRSPAEDPA